MNRSLVVTTLLAAALSLGAAGIRAAADTSPTLMAPADFNQVKASIESGSRLALAACRDAVPAEREICRAQARAEARVQKADLEARYYGTAAAQSSARTVRAKATYEVAKARCGLQSGQERSDCQRAAREDRTRQMAQAS
jgi:hyperosmotically inducible protein